MAQSRSDSLSQDAVFDILSNARRRYVLYYLREAGEPVELRELARELAKWENKATEEELTKQQRKRVYVSLYQTHIQKLADAGIVEYDQDSGMVSLANAASQINPYLSPDGNDEGQTQWQALYLVLALVSGAVYLLVAFDVSVFSLVSEFMVGVVIVLAFAFVATIHYLVTRRREPDIPSEALIQDEP